MRYYTLLLILSLFFSQCLIATDEGALSEQQLRRRAKAQSEDAQQPPEPSGVDTAGDVSADSNTGNPGSVVVWGNPQVAIAGAVADLLSFFRKMSCISGQE